MSKNKKFIIGVFSGIGICILIFFIAVGITVYKDLRIESDIKEEFNSLEKLINDTDINNAAIDRRLNLTVSQGDYVYVEKAIKNYLKDLLVASRKLNKIFTTTYFDDLLSVDNFAQDGPEFNQTFKFINDLKAELQEVQDDFLTLLNYKTIMSYMNEPLDDYYIDFYESLTASQSEINTNRKNIKKLVQESLEVISVYESLFIFLKENGSHWEIAEKYIVFDTDELVSEYDLIIKKIENIAFSKIEVNI